jgi:hypothetical protein
MTTASLILFPLQFFKSLNFIPTSTYAYVPSINNAQPVTTDRLRRKYLTGEMKTDRITDSKPPPPQFPWRSDERDDDRGTNTFNTYEERRLTLYTCARLLRVHLAILITYTRTC